MSKLEARAIHKTFGSDAQAVRALRGVDISVARGRAVGLVGESGSGKSTLVKVLTLLEKPDSGAVMLDGVELKAWSSAKRRGFQRVVQPVFQAAFESLNPRMRVIDLAREGLDIWRIGKRPERLDRAAEILTSIGIGAEHFNKYPHQLSGGQRQRVAIARALVLNPNILIADEPTSALDTSVQAEIAKILANLKNKGVGTLVVSHDLRIIRRTVDTCHVMLAGIIVESGPVEPLFKEPKHPYTQELTRSIPTLKGVDVTSSELKPLADMGCPYSTRCPFAEDICRAELPETKEAADGWSIRCHIV